MTLDYQIIDCKLIVALLFFDGTFSKCVYYAEVLTLTYLQKNSIATVA